MRETNIWMCEDKGSPADSSFGRTKKQAERRAANSRGYDSVVEAQADKWLPKRGAVQIRVPSVAAKVLLKASE